MLCLLSSRYQTRNRATALLQCNFLYPSFTSGRMDKDEIVSVKNLSKRAGPNTVHTAWLKIHQYRSRDVLSTHNFIKTHIDTLQFQIRIAFIVSSKPVMANDDSSTRRWYIFTASLLGWRYSPSSSHFCLLRLILNELQSKTCTSYTLYNFLANSKNLH